MQVLLILVAFVTTLLTIIYICRRISWNIKWSKIPWKKVWGVTQVVGVLLLMGGFLILFLGCFVNLGFAFIAAAFDLPPEAVQSHASASGAWVDPPFDSGHLLTVYGHEPFTNGWQAMPTVVTPTYTVPLPSEDGTVYSGLNCALAGPYAPLIVDFPQRDFVTGKELMLVGESSTLALASHNHFTAGDATLLFLRGAGTPGDIYTPTLRLEEASDAVRIATIKDATGGQELKWGRVPPATLARWTLYVRFADETESNLSTATLMANRGGYLLLTPDGTEIIHEGFLAQAETTLGGSGITDEEALLVITTPPIGDTVRTEVVVRIEP